MEEGSDPTEHIGEMTKLIQQLRSSGENFDDFSAARGLTGSLLRLFFVYQGSSVDTLSLSQSAEAVRKF